MCSRYNKKQTDLTEKPKIKKSKTIQMKYPAPYSQSWSGQPQNSKKATNRSSTSQKVSRQDARTPPRRRRGPDPTVPHLKYGLFPKKRGQSRTVTSNSVQEADTTEAKARPKTATDSDMSAPLFVVRALDSRFTRRLTRAASTHLDIKPRNVK